TAELRLAINDIQIGIPDEAELVRVIRVDLGQWAEALLTVGSAVSHPVGAILDGRLNPGAVHISPGLLSPGRFEGARGKTENESHDGADDQVLIVCQPNAASKPARAGRPGPACYRAPANPSIFRDPQQLHRTGLLRIPRRWLCHAQLHCRVTATTPGAD